MNTTGPQPGIPEPRNHPSGTPDPHDHLTAERTDPFPLITDPAEILQQRRAPLGLFDDPTGYLALDSPQRPISPPADNPLTAASLPTGVARVAESLPTPRHAGVLDTPARPDSAEYPDRSDPNTPDSMRRQVVDRLALVGRRHARHRTDLLATAERPGPHVIVFFYRRTDADGTPKVAIASRMFLDGPDVTDLAEVLRTLRERAREFHHNGWLDPRHHLSTSRETVAIAGRYHGIGTSTLLPAQPGAGEPAWQGLARLVDGTRLRMHTTHSVRPLHVESTHTLDVRTIFALSSGYDWRWATPSPWRDPDQDPTGLDAARTALDELHAFLADPDAPRQNIGAADPAVGTSGRSGRPR